MIVEELPEEEQELLWDKYYEWCKTHEPFHYEEEVLATRSGFPTWDIRSVYELIQS